MGVTLKDVTSTVDSVGKIAGVISKFTSVNNNYNRNESSFSKEELEAINSLPEEERSKKLKDYLDARIEFIQKNNKRITEESKAQNDFTSSQYWASFGKDVFKATAISIIAAGAGFMFKKIFESVEA
jgi:hypothetical protein